MMAPSITIPFLDENPAHDILATIAADMPGRQLKAGQNVTLRPVAAIDADAVFAFQDGSLARVQHWADKSFRVTDSEGVVTIIKRADMIPVFARLIYDRPDTPAKEVAE